MRCNIGPTEECQTVRPKRCQLRQRASAQRSLLREGRFSIACFQTRTHLQTTIPLKPFLHCNACAMRMASRSRRYRLLLQRVHPLWQRTVHAVWRPLVEIAHGVTTKRTISVSVGASTDFIVHLQLVATTFMPFCRR